MRYVVFALVMLYPHQGNSKVWDHFADSAIALVGVQHYDAKLLLHLGIQCYFGRDFQFLQPNSILTL